VTTEEAMALKPGDIVSVFWPGSNSGADCKRAMVRVVSPTGKVGVNVVRTTPGGKYTGDYGRSVRWFDSSDILDIES